MSGSLLYAIVSEAVQVNACPLTAAGNESLIRFLSPSAESVTVKRGLRNDVIVDKHSAFGEFLWNGCADCYVPYFYIFHWGYLPVIFLRAYSEMETPAFFAATDKALYSSFVMRKWITVSRLSDAVFVGRPNFLMA